MKRVLVLVVFLAVFGAIFTECCKGGSSTQVTFAATTNDDKEWFDHYYPYRIEIELDGEYEGKVAVDISIEKIIKALADVSPDVVNLHSFAFEKALLVDPASKKVVGGFKLFPEVENLALHGNFDPSQDMSTSPWKRFQPAAMKIEQVHDDGETFNALFVTKEKVTNSWLSQSVELEPGAMYLLDYKVKDCILRCVVGVQSHIYILWHFV